MFAQLFASIARKATEMNTPTLTVFSLIAAGTMHYVRAASAAHARVRAHKCWGQPFKVTPVGNWAPDTVGAFGYKQWVRESEAKARAEYYPPASDEVSKYVKVDDSEVARLMAMLK